jgi:hypothetical protein
VDVLGETSFLTLFYNPSILQPSTNSRPGGAGRAATKLAPAAAHPSRGAPAAIGRAPLPLVVLACFFISS